MAAGLAMCTVLWVAPRAMAQGPSPAPAPPSTVAAGPTTTTTLPPLPSVPLKYTDGQAPQALLTNAISLASLGVDDSALLRAVDATQAKLDADASTVRTADSQAAAAAARRAAALRVAARARRQYRDMASAVRQAVVFLYTAGPEALSISPRAGNLALYAQDYAQTALDPLGVLAQRKTVEEQESEALAAADTAARAASDAAGRAARAMADQQRQLTRLRAELASASKVTAAAVEADHVALAGQAGKDLLADSALQFTPKSPIPAPVATTAVALTWAFAELGKPYVWGATGPATFDCSGLTQFVWKAAGVAIPRVAADQDSWTIPVPLSQLLPGDLVFFGTTNIHHVGIYIGDGLMINAPHTGTVVQVDSIWWSDLAGFGRVHSAGVPVPPHAIPTAQQPAPQSVVAAAGPVPSQTAPPAGWKPAPGSSTPIALPGTGKQGSVVPQATTTTTTVVPTTGTTEATTLPGPTTTVTTASADGSTTTTTVGAAPAVTGG